MRRFLIVPWLWAAVSAPIWADCNLTKISDIKPVLENGHIYLKSKINDKPVLFIVDTGTQQTILFREAAEELGLVISAFGAKLYANSGGSNNQMNGAFQAMGNETASTSYRAGIDRLELGPLAITNQFLVVSDRHSDAPASEIPVAGLVGEDILSRYDVEFDLGNGRLALYQPEGCDGANLAYWSQDYNVVDMVRYNPKEPRVLMSGRLNDTKTLMQISSGMPFTVVSTTAASSRGVSSDDRDAKELGSVMGIQGESARAWLGTFSGFSLDEEKIGQSKIAFIKFPSAKEADIERGSRLAKTSEVTNADMALGVDFLQTHRLMISHSQKKVYFSYMGGVPFSAPGAQATEASK